MDIHVYSTNSDIANDVVSSIRTYFPHKQTKIIDKLSKHDMNTMLLLVFSMNDETSYIELETMLKEIFFVSKYNKTVLVAYRPDDLGQSISTRNIVLHNLMYIPIIFIYKGYIPRNSLRVLSG